MNKILVLTSNGKVSSDVADFIKKRFDPEAEIIPSCVPTGNKKVRNEIAGMASQGPILTSRFELNRKAMKKIKDTGVTFTEIIVHPITNRPTHHVVHNPPLAMA